MYYLSFYLENEIESDDDESEDDEVELEESELEESEDENTGIQDDDKEVSLHKYILTVVTFFIILYHP